MQPADNSRRSTQGKTVVSWRGAQTTATRRQAPSDQAVPGRLDVRNRKRRRKQRCCLERQHAGQFQLHDDHVQQRGHRRAPDFNHEMRGFAVQRIALGIQVAQPLQRVCHLQQRARGVVAQAPVNVVGLGVQVHHLPAPVQALAVGGPQNGTTPGGQHRRRSASGQFIEGGLFEIAKARFAFAVKKSADRATDPLFNHMVRVQKRHPQPAGKLPAQGGFAGAREAYEGNHNYSITIWQPNPWH